MGFTTIPVEIAPLNGGAGVLVKVLVDTGSAVTIIPARLLRGIKKTNLGPIRLRMADGRTTVRRSADLYVSFRVNGRREKIPARVVLGSSRDAAILGVPVLETAGYGVDPVSKKLVKVGHLVA